MIGVVFRKELTDHWRDRRSVLGVLVMPVIGPLLLLLVFGLIADQQVDKRLEIPLAGAEHAPQLVEFLTMAGVTTVDPPDDPDAAVVAGDVDFVLRIPADYPERVKETRTAAVELLVDGSNTKAIGDTMYVRALVDAYSQSKARQRLILRGVAPEVAQPVILREVDLAPKRRSAANILGIIPMFLVLIAFIGGMNIAIDTTAGERERGSLEPLLLHPVSRVRLILGKWLATSVFATGVLFLGVAGFVLAVSASTYDLGIPVIFGVSEALPVLAALLPLAMLASALQMLLATFARTFKEAQTYLSLVSLVPVAPALYLMFESKATELWMMCVPAMGQHAVITDILRGDGASPLFLGILWASSALYCALTIGLLVKLLGRETVVFGR